MSAVWWSSLFNQVQTDWNATLGKGVLLNKPSTFPPDLHSQPWATITATPTTLGDYGITDAYPLTGNPSGYVNQAGARSSISLTTTGSGSATYNAGSGVLNIPNLTPNARAQSSTSRALNTAFQVSATRDSLVSYSVQITVTASIAGGQNGDVILEIASDSAFTTNVQTIGVSGVGQTYTLAIALQGVQPQTSPVFGFVPAGYYVRLRTVNNTGTPAYSYRFGQETLL